MRWLIGLTAAASLAALIWLFALGGMVDVARWAAAGQREAQNALATALRALRAGEAGAWLSLMTVCAAYGFFHAAGPGHGKLVIGGYGAAERVSLRFLTVLALASSLAQAGTAILLVAVGASIFGLGREAMTQTAEAILAPASYAAIAFVGCWLTLRGVRKLMVKPHHHDHDHDHHHHDHSCGHAHGPSIEDVAGIQSWRDAVGVVAAVAVRPCTGAVFLLILCFGFGIPLAGIAGALVMGLGTAGLTILVAIAAVSMRETVLAPLQGTTAARAMAAIEIGAGLFVALVGASLAMRFLG